MSDISIESGKEILQKNIRTVYNLSPKFSELNHYLNAYGGTLKDTLLSVLNYIDHGGTDRKHMFVLFKHQYVFMYDTKRITRKVRKKEGGSGTSARHMNLLCAIGFFRKLSPNQTEQMQMSQNSKGERKRTVNSFAFVKFDMRQLEENAARLRAAGVTSGNISFNYLMLHGLEDIARRVFPSNIEESAAKKKREKEELFKVVKALIDAKGYAYRYEISDNLLYDDREIERLFKLFGKDLTAVYHFAPPTKEQMKKWDLKSRKYIYTRRNDFDESLETTKG